MFHIKELLIITRISIDLHEHEMSCIVIELRMHNKYGSWLNKPCHFIGHAELPHTYMHTHKSYSKCFLSIVRSLIRYQDAHLDT
jgi:hypothetical protein